MVFNPPGITGEWVLETEGGQSPTWLELKTLKHYTNAFVWDEKEHKILLGLKKRGFGVDMWNGFGGKVDKDETPLQAAKRELKEEAGIDAPLIKCGTLLFNNEGTDFVHLIHIFRANEWSGIPTESEEMRPQWFSMPNQQLKCLDPIPFEKMWEDDRFWFPLMLNKITFAGRVDFSGLAEDGTGGDMLKFWFGTSQQIETSPQ